MACAIDGATATALTLAEVIDDIANNPRVPRTLGLVQNQRKVLEESTGTLNPNLGGVPGIHSCRVGFGGSAPNRRRIPKGRRLTSTGLTAKV